MFQELHHSQTMPPTGPADPYRITQPFTNRQHDTRTSQTTSRHMFLHNDTPFWSSRQSPATCIVRQIFLNIKHTQHRNQNSHHRTHRNFVTLQTKDTPTITDTDQNDYHLHRRLLLRRTENMEKQRLHRRRRCAQFWFWLYERMGGSGIPTRQNPDSYPRGRPLENLKTFYQQPRIHIFSRSLGSYRDTSPCQTTAHTPIHTTMRQRPSNTRDQQGIW